MPTATPARLYRAWNKGRLVGSKLALKPKQVWAVRFHLKRDGRLCDLTLFDLAIDSKLRGCDLVQLRIGDVLSGGIAQPGTRHPAEDRPVQFEVTAGMRDSVLTWLCVAAGSKSRGSMQPPFSVCASR